MLKKLTFVCCILCLFGNASIIACETADDAEDDETFYFLNAVTHPNVAYVSKALSEKRIDLNTIKLPEGSYPPLHAASMVGSDEMVKLLLDAGAKIDEQDKNGETALHIAARAQNLGSPAIVHWLILKHANVEIKNKEGKTPLHIAAEYCARFIAEMLINAGADINAQTNNASTPLMLAQQEGQRELVDLLRKTQWKNWITRCVIS